MVPLATEGPLELVSSLVKEIGCKESVDNCQPSQWVTNGIKAFKLARDLTPILICNLRMIFLFLLKLMRKI